MRIVDVSRRENQVRPDRTKESPHDRAVRLPELAPGSGRRAIERKLEEVKEACRHAADPRRGEGLLAAHKALQARDPRGFRERALRIMRLEENAHLLRRRLSRNARGVGKPERPQEHIVRDRVGTGDLVGDVHLVAVLDKPAKRAAHADDVVVGMRRED